MAKKLQHSGRPRKNLPEQDVQGGVVVSNVPLSEILFDSDFNCRGDFTYESVKQLADTINDAGLLNPVILWPRPKLPAKKKYLLIAGHRRYRAHELLKRDVIPAFIRDDLDQRKAEIINLIENLARKDLNILEEAMALKKRFPKDMPMRHIAKELNQSFDWVKDRICFLQLPLDIQQKIASKLIPLRYIQPLAQIQEEKGPAAALKAAKDIEDARRKDGRIQFKKLSSDIRQTKFEKPSTQEILHVLTTMLDSSVIGLAPRFAAYTQGWISKEEFVEDMKKSIPKWAVRAAEEQSE